MDFTEIARWIQSQVDVSFETALQYADAIGDTPSIDENGLTEIVDVTTGEIIARIKLDWANETMP